MGSNPILHPKIMMEVAQLVEQESKTYQPENENNGYNKKLN